MSGKYQVNPQLKVIPVPAKIPNNLSFVTNTIQRFNLSFVRDLSLMQTRPTRVTCFDFVIEHVADINRSNIHGTEIEGPSERIASSIRELDPSLSRRLEYFLKKIVEKSPFEEVKKAAARRLLKDKCEDVIFNRIIDNKLAEIAVCYNQVFGTQDGVGRLRSRIITEEGEVNIATLTMYPGVKMEIPSASFILMGEIDLEYGKKAPKAISYCRAGYGQNHGTNFEIVLGAISNHW